MGHLGIRHECVPGHLRHRLQYARVEDASGAKLCTHHLLPQGLVVRIHGYSVRPERGRSSGKAYIYSKLN
jgi:hypothetical protein